MGILAGKRWGGFEAEGKIKAGRVHGWGLEYSVAEDEVQVNEKLGLKGRS